MCLLYATSVPDPAASHLSPSLSLSLSVSPYAACPRSPSGQCALPPAHASNAPRVRRAPARGRPRPANTVGYSVAAPAPRAPAPRRGGRPPPRLARRRADKARHALHWRAAATRGAPRPPPPPRSPARPAAPAAVSTPSHFRPLLPKPRARPPALPPGERRCAKSRGARARRAHDGARRAPSNRRVGQKHTRRLGTARTRGRGPLAGRVARRHWRADIKVTRPASSSTPARAAEPRAASIPAASPLGAPRSRARRLARRDIFARRAPTHDRPRPVMLRRNPAAGRAAVLAASPLQTQLSLGLATLYIPHSLANGKAR